MKIAVVGIGCHYPGASSAHELFENVMAGRQAFRRIPVERWRIDDYYHPDKEHPDTTYCKKAAFVENFVFNPEEFRIPRSTWRATDTAQWLALKVARDALQDAALENINRDNVGVIVGNTLTGEVSRASVLRYRWPYAQKVFAELLRELSIDEEQGTYLMQRIEQRFKAPFAPVNEDNLAGGLSNTIAGRICNFFDFKGGGFSTDGACSSSLLAINQACIALEHGTCDLALAGGVDISLDPFEMVGFAKVGALSHNDINVYDEQSGGFLPGEGCGMVVLQRLEDALAHGASIYAVINGIGISSDGKGGITAPSVAGQSLAVDRAYHIAGYRFSEVELIEGHGTGTPMGDNVELQTFIEAFKRHGARATHRCGIGSVKSIIGHTKAAAGVAGFIKAVMAVCYDILPPTQGIRSPNRLFQQSSTLFPLCVAERWDNPAGVRRAAVSSAGFGGINTHITLSNAEADSSRYCEARRDAYLALSYTAQSSEVLFLGAASIDDLLTQLQMLHEIVERVSTAELADLSYYTSTALKSHRIRVALVVDSVEDACIKLENLQRALNTKVESETNDIASPEGSLSAITPFSGGNPNCTSTNITSTNIATDRHLTDLAYVDFEQGIFLQTELNQPLIAFMFPGQGSQALNMGRCLKHRSPSAARVWRQCDELLVESGKNGVSEAVFIDHAHTPSGDYGARGEQLQDTSVAQPALTVMSLALTAFLKDIGIRPDMVVGHSLGEYAALCCAGALDVATALRLVSARGEAMGSLAGKPGGMLSVNASAEKVRALLPEVVGEMVIANKNSPRQTVVSGELTALTRLKELCAYAAIPAEWLPVSHAFHSPMVAQAADAMRAPLQAARFNRLRTPVVSPTSADFVNDATDFEDLLYRQILQPVEYIGALEHLIDEGCRVFVEVGPGRVLSGLTEQILGDREALVCSADIGDRGQYAQGLNRLVAYLFSCGVTINLDEFFRGRLLRPFPWPYNPRFIESPCEAQTEPLSLDGPLHARAGGDLAQEKSTTAPGQNIADPTDDRSGAATGEVHSVSAIVELLRRHVMQTYGYSAEMVTPHARLQENLGLDSLKSVEVAYEIMGNLGVRGDISKLGDSSIEKLAAYIYDLTTAVKANGEAISEQGLASVLPSWTRAFSCETVAAARRRKAPSTQQGLLSDSRVLIVYETESPLVRALSATFKTETRVCAAGSLADGEGQVPAFDVCIYLANDAFSLVDSLDTSAAANARRRQRPRSLLRLAKEIAVVDTHDRKHEGAEFKRSHWFVFVTEQGGQFDASGQLKDFAAGTGFVRTLHLEHPAINTRCLDFNPALSSSDKAALILAELGQGNGHIDIGYPKKDDRRLLRFRPCAANSLPLTDNPLVDGDVVLVSGGAKGITAECVLRLSRAQQLRVALLGSTSADEQLKENDSELHDNLRRFTTAGVDYGYYCCDIGNAAEVRTTVDRVTAELGPIKAVIHAAGINRLHKIADVEWDDFESVQVPKVDGLIHLLNAIDPGSIKHLAVFSSVIGASGMAANSSYAYANEWMTQLLRRLAAAYPRVNVQAYGFSVWRTVGMGQRLNSIDRLSAMGIEAIEVEQGVELFQRLFSRRWPQSHLVIGARMGSMNTLNFAFPAAHPSRFTENVLHLQPGVEMISEVFLQPEVDAYLNDHNYEGSLLFPAVLGIEAMVQCAQYCREGQPQASHNGAGPRYPRLENLNFERAIVVPPEGRRIRIYVQLDEPDASARERARVFIRSSVTDYQVDYFSAECIWSNSPESEIDGVKGDLLQLAPCTADDGAAGVNLDPARDLYGKILFQGAMFQHIDRYLQVSSTHCVVRIKVPEQYQLFANGFGAQPPAFGTAQLRDAFLHAVQLCVPQYRILPVSIHSIDHAGFDTGFVTLYAREREHSANEFLYDLEVHDARGKPIECIRGFRCRIVGSYDDLAVLERIHAAHRDSKNSDFLSA